MWNEELQSLEERFDLLFYALTQFLFAHFLYLLMFVLVSDRNVASIRNQVLSLVASKLFNLDREVVVYEVKYSVFQHPHKVAIVCFVNIF